MSSIFTPSDVVDMSKERDWPANLGMLDWDKTNIVFTKRSLIEFLKYTGTTVDTNFANIAKLPRYAQFGKLSAAEEAEAQPSTVEGVPKAASAGSHGNIFATEDEDDALSQAPSRPANQSMTETTTRRHEAADTNEGHTGLAFTSEVKPSRRVREHPGGKSSLANFWDEPETTEFKPTRRVREGPGGHDSIGGLF